MKAVFAVAAAVTMAAVALDAWAGTTAQTSDPLALAHVTAAVETSKPVLARVTATEVDGNDLAVDELLKIANVEDEDLRLAAVEVLGEMASPRSRAVLGVILYSNKLATVRAAAADQLGNFGDGEALFALALALEMERDAEVRDVIAANLERNLPVEPAPTLPGRPEVAMADAG